jgi:hypothetical protein
MKHLLSTGLLYIHLSMRIHVLDYLFCLVLDVFQGCLILNCMISARAAARGV